MNIEQFGYWLQGFVELTAGEEPTPRQWQIIKDHLQLVFTKVTPDRADKVEDTQTPIAPIADKSKTANTAKTITDLAETDLAEVMRQLSKSSQQLLPHPSEPHRWKLPAYSQWTNLPDFPTLTC